MGFVTVITKTVVKTFLYQPQGVGFIGDRDYSGKPVKLMRRDRFMVCPTE